MGRTHVLERVQLVPRPRPEVWAFFADPANLEAITPDFLRFRVVTPAPVPMAAGALIDYRLSLFGLPFSWSTRIDEVVALERFVDVQLSGPYHRWRQLGQPKNASLCRVRMSGGGEAWHMVAYSQDV